MNDLKRVIVCGSRTWRDSSAIHRELSSLPKSAVIVHGAAPGADRLAHVIAEKLGMETDPRPADWSFYGRSAGVIRNREMAQAGADLCIAFWDGGSPGTKNMIRVARENGIPVKEVKQ